jgi:hypothetical protein
MPMQKLATHMMRMTVEVTPPVLVFMILFLESPSNEDFPLDLNESTGVGALEKLEALFNANL